MEKSRCRRSCTVPSHRERIQVSPLPPITSMPNISTTDKSEERVRRGAEKLQKHLNSKQQGRLDGFFTVKPKTSPKKGKDANEKEGKGKGKGTKRKVRCFFSVYFQNYTFYSFVVSAS